MLGNYENIIERISRSSGVAKDEIERRVEAKRAKLSGLISKEGAAQVIAAELGISFDNEKLKIGELLPGMRKVNVIGKVLNRFPVRTFVRNGKESKVANIVIADETSNIKVVFWDVNHIALIERDEIIEGKVIEIANASMRDNEVHLGSFSDVKLINDEMKGVIVEGKISKEKKILEVKNSDNAKLRAFIVQTFGPRTFDICPECRKKVVQEADGFSCEQHGRVVPQRRALINLVLDDGTETIRAVVFSNNFPMLGILDWENSDEEKIFLQRQELLGKEMFFFGDIRTNKFFNNLELNIDKIEEIDLGNLIQDLEKKN
jgi:replication factor A1